MFLLIKRVKQALVGRVLLLDAGHLLKNLLLQFCVLAFDLFRLRFHFTVKQGQQLRQLRIIELLPTSLHITQRAAHVSDSTTHSSYTSHMHHTSVGSGPEAPRSE